MGRYTYRSTKGSGKVVVDQSGAYSSTRVAEKLLLSRVEPIAQPRGSGKVVVIRVGPTEVWLVAIVVAVSWCGSSQKRLIKGQIRRVCGQNVTTMISICILQHLLRQTEQLWVCSVC